MELDSLATPTSPHQWRGRPCWASVGAADHYPSAHQCPKPRPPIAQGGASSMGSARRMNASTQRGTQVTRSAASIISDTGHRSSRRQRTDQLHRRLTCAQASLRTSYGCKFESVGRSMRASRAHKRLAGEASSDKTGVYAWGWNRCECMPCVGGVPGVTCVGCTCVAITWLGS